MPSPSSARSPPAQSDGAPLSLTLLGRFRLSGPLGDIDLGSRKLCGLLAFLACTAPEPQGRERLMTLFWGSHFDAQAKQNLRQALFRLRKVLGQDALESDGEVVSLNAAAVLCDVGRFEALVREGSRDALSAAADLYRGRLIDDVAVSEEGWNEWLTGERERLLELALGAMVRARRTGTGRRPRRTRSEGRPARHRAQQHARGRPSADRTGAGRHGTQGRSAQALPGPRCTAQARAEHGARCGNQVARRRASQHTQPPEQIAPAVDRTIAHAISGDTRAGGERRERRSARRCGIVCAWRSARAAPSGDS